MQLFSLVVLDPLRQPSGIVQLRTCLQTFLEFGDAPFDGLKHLLRLITGIAENENPSILTELFSHGFRIRFQHLVAVLQLVSPFFKLLAGTGKDLFCP